MLLWMYEDESQVTVYESEGTLLGERRTPTKRLPKYISSLPGEKHAGMESVGFIYRYMLASWVLGATTQTEDDLSSLLTCGLPILFLP